MGDSPVNHIFLISVETASIRYGEAAAASTPTSHRTWSVSDDVEEDARDNSGDKGFSVTAGWAVARFLSDERVNTFGLELP